MSHEFRQLYSSGAVGGTNAPNMLYSKFPFISVWSPGMPAPGPDFVRLATMTCGVDPVTQRPIDQQMTNQEIDRLYYRALYDDRFTLPLSFEGRVVSTEFMLGGLLGMGSPDGPRGAKVMVVLKNPSREDFQRRQIFSGDTGAIFRNTLEAAGITDYPNWYASYTVRHGHLSPAGGQMSAAWKKNCLPLLFMEIALVRPQFVLLVGGDSVKALLGKNTLKSTKDQVFDVELPLPDGTKHACKVISCIDPAVLVRSPERMPELETTIRQFAGLLETGTYDTIEPGILHLKVTDAYQLKNLVDAVLNDPEVYAIAVDAEWHQPFPTEDGAYVRTVQFSWRAKCAASVVLHAPGGQPCFIGGVAQAVEQLKRLFTTRPMRLIGHYLIADLPWLKSIGWDLHKHYLVPAHFEETRNKGGWDTMIGAHAAEETASVKLEDLTVRFCRMPRHDVKLQRWKKEFCRVNKIKEDQLEGYGECPDDVLVGEECGDETPFGVPVRESYGCYDADGTYRMFELQNGTPNQVGMVDQDRFGLSSREAFHRTMGAMPAYGEMHARGVILDVEEVARKRVAYQTITDGIYAKLRAALNWPTFNASSHPQCVEMLFGPEYNRKRHKVTGELVSVRPPGAVSLRLTPYKTTGKRSKLWEDVIARGETHLYKPAADKEAFSHLATPDQPIVILLRDLRTVQQLLTTILQPPKRVRVRPVINEDDEPATDISAEAESATLPATEGQDAEVNDEVEVEDAGADEPQFVEKQLGGVLFHLQKGNVLRPQFFPTKDTGRSGCVRPAMQNWGKTVEEKYQACYARYGAELNVVYPGPVRSCLVARPGHVIVDPDYTGAELAIIAWVSGDQLMIEHVRRNALPEDHPDYFDIHSNTAVRAFRLSCPPTKSGLKAAGKVNLRTAAKRIIFGKLYGQTPASMARKIREDGTPISVEEAEMLDAAIDEMYPALPAYFTECRERAGYPGWIRSCFNRLRRGATTTDRAARGDQERQFMNFGMQAAVGDAMKSALGNFMMYREYHHATNPDSDKTFHMLLEIHDACPLEVPINSLEWVVDEVVPLCMSELVPITPRKLDGTLVDVKPYRLATPPPDVFERWSVPLTVEDCDRLKIAHRFAGH